MPGSWKTINGRRFYDGDDGVDTARGSDLDESLFGKGGDDVLDGGAGNDSMEGEGGGDWLRGGAGNDRIATDHDYRTGASLPENDRAFGEGGDDSLTGGLGKDTLDGGIGNDMVTLSLRRDGAGFALDSGADSFQGGAGIDILAISSLLFSGDNLRARVVLGATTTIQLNGATIATAQGFERLDVALHGSGAHSVTAGGYDDRVITGGGNDYVDAGRGAETVTAGAGNDTVLMKLSGPDSVDMGEGDDSLTLYGLYVSDPTPPVGGATFRGGLGTDTLVLFVGARGLAFDGTTIRIEGLVIGTVAGFERVQLVGNSLAERMNGGAGNDNLSLAGGGDSSDGGGGNDSIDGGAGNDSMVGGTGDDTLVAGAGADTLEGGVGNDSLTATLDLGTDSIAGDTGTDALSLTVAGSGAVVMAGSFAGVVTLSLGGTQAARFSGIEALSLVSGAGNDSLFGGTGNDRLDGGAGSDALDGGAGSDTLRGGGGDDSLISFFGQGPDSLDGGAGGADFARIYRTTLTQDLTFSLATPAVAQLVPDGTRIINVERVDLLAGSGNDTLTGGALADTLSSSGGHDLLTGGGGDDLLADGPGLDTLRGGGGNDSLSSRDAGDVMDGGAGTDDLATLLRFGAAAALTVTFATPATLQVLSDGTRLVGLERGWVFGGSGNDTLTGGALGDQFGGGGGNDQLSGGAGLGNDTRFGDEGNDVVTGLFGNDSLAGGAGNDTLAGGAGSDRFRFESLEAAGIDRVLDFTAADLISVSRFGFGGGLQFQTSATLVANAAPVAPAASIGGVFLYETDTGLLSFDADGGGAGLAVGFAVLRSGAAAAALTSAQILLE